MGQPKRGVTANDRFWAKVNKNGPVHPVCGQCWEWTGLTEFGYGRFKANGIIIKVHRYSYILHYSNPGDSFVLHKCDNPKCVNPEHLFLGTHQENMKDMKGKDRQCKGVDKPKAILTEDDVHLIRSLYRKGRRGRGYPALGKQFGVSGKAIEFIIKGKTWTHI